MCKAIQCEYEIPSLGCPIAKIPTCEIVELSIILLATSQGNVLEGQKVCRFALETKDLVLAYDVELLCDVGESNPAQLLSSTSWKAIMLTTTPTPLFSGNQDASYLM